MRHWFWLGVGDIIVVQIDITRIGILIVGMAFPAGKNGGVLGCVKTAAQ